MAQQFSVSRERKGKEAFWVHVSGPSGAEARAGSAADAEARRWAAEVKRGRAYRRRTVSPRPVVTESGARVFVKSICYGFN